MTEFVEYAKKHGPWMVLCGLLLWFLLDGVSAAVKEHDQGTRGLLRAICVNTALAAGASTVECVR